MTESVFREPVPVWTSERIKQWYATLAEQDLDRVEEFREAVTGFVAELRNDVQQLLDSMGLPSDTAAVDRILAYSGLYHALVQSGVRNSDSRLTAVRTEDERPIITFIESEITEFFKRVVK